MASHLLRNCASKFIHAAKPATILLASSSRPAARLTLQRFVQAQARSGARSWETVAKPRGFSAENAGRIVLGAGSFVGVGALCFYGLGLSNEVGAIDKARYWPAEVRNRVKSTYLYFTGSIGVTAIAAYAVSQSRLVVTMATGNRWLILGGSLVAMIGSSIACQSLPYEAGLNGKHLAWLVHSGVIGTVIAPLMLLGGPIVMRAAIYTAGTVAALSLTAASAPDGKFLTWGGPLSLCLGGLCVASIGGMFLPVGSAAAVGIQSAMTYGGLVLFGGFMLYDTQKIVRYAEQSAYQGIPYDPINASLGIYMDTINILIRLLVILSGNQKRK